MLIETLDLAVASPATVSRNGMVYNDYKDWGWWPYVNSWLETLENADYREMVSGCSSKLLYAVIP